MIKFLFDYGKNLPWVGDAIKVAYLGSLVKELIEKGKNSPAKDELKKLTGDELEDALNGQANDMFDEAVGPVIAENNIPEPLAKPVKEKAIEELIGVLREKVENKVDPKK